MNVSGGILFTSTRLLQEFWVLVSLVFCVCVYGIKVKYWLGMVVFVMDCVYNGLFL